MSRPRVVFREETDRDVVWLYCPHPPGPSHTIPAPILVAAVAVIVLLTARFGPPILIVSIVGGALAWTGFRSHLASSPGVRVRIDRSGVAFETVVELPPAPNSPREGRAIHRSTVAWRDLAHIRSHDARIRLVRTDGTTATLPTLPDDATSEISHQIEAFHRHHDPSPGADPTADLQRLSALIGAQNTASRQEPR